MWMPAAIHSLGDTPRSPAPKDPAIPIMLTLGPIDSGNVTIGTLRARQPAYINL